MLDFHADQDPPFQLILRVLPHFQFNRKLKCCFFKLLFPPFFADTIPDLVSLLSFPPVGGTNHRITESQNSRGWKGPLWVI